MFRPRMLGAALSLATLTQALAFQQPLQPTAPTPAPPRSDTPLPTDPNVVSGALDNGLKYMVLRHDKPPGRAVVWLHVDSGSLNEKDNQRGLAHYLEHMAFNGSANFPPGSVVPFFQSLGMTFGRHQNAFTSFDQTVYQLTLPDAKPETLDKAMLFLSDAAFRLTLTDEEIDKERRIILEERRRGLSAERRVNDYTLEHLAPGSLMGRRLTIGTEDTIAALKHDDFVDYYTRWYVPANMTVLAVANTDPKAVIDAIKARFSDGKKAPRPTPQDAGVTPTRGVRAIVATDADLTRAEVSIASVGPAPAPTRTVGQWREELVRRLATQAFNRRISDKQALGLMKSLTFSARAGVTGGAMFHAEVSATGETDSWRDMLAELATEVQRARAHGFTADEVAQVRAQVLAGAKRAAETERTRQARVLIDLMNQAVAADEPFMSPSQEYEITSAVLATVTDAEVSKAFASLFDPANVVLVAALPLSAGEVSEKDVLDAGAAALAVIPPPDAAPARATTLLDKLPVPGEIVESSDHTVAAVTSAWLSNGARVHHRFMDYRLNTATITILLAGGELLDTPATRGLARAASVGWIQPATSKLPSTDIKNLLTGKNLTIIGRAESDAMVISVTGPPERLETGLQVAYLMLTDPRIEAPAFDQWKRRMLQVIDRAAQDTIGAAARLLPDTVYPPGEVRPRLLTSEQVSALKIEDAQAWLSKAVATCPIEVSVVGDIGKERAFELVSRYIGSLPARERIGPGTFKSLRAIAPPEGPKSARLEVPSTTPKASVMCGFFGPDASALRDTRLLRMASRILSTRMTSEIREEKQLVYTIGVRSDPGEVYPGYGLVSAQATADPKNAETLAEALNTVFADFARDGPTADEMDVAHKQFAKDIDLDLLDPSFWSGELRDLTYRGQSLDDTMDTPAAFAAFTGQEVREAFAKYCTPKRAVKVIVVPAPGA